MAGSVPTKTLPGRIRKGRRRRRARACGIRELAEMLLGVWK